MTINTKPEHLSLQDWEDMLAEEELYKRIEARQDQLEQEELDAGEFNFERDCGANY